MMQKTETRADRLNRLAHLAKSGESFALATNACIDRTIRLADQARQAVVQAKQDAQLAEQWLEEARAISKRIGWPDKISSQSS